QREIGPRHLHERGDAHEQQQDDADGERRLDEHAAALVSRKTAGVHSARALPTVTYSRSPSSAPIGWNNVGRCPCTVTTTSSFDCVGRVSSTLSTWNPPARCCT